MQQYISRILIAPAPPRKQGNQRSQTINISRTVNTLESQMGDDDLRNTKNNQQMCKLAKVYFIFCLYCLYYRQPVNCIE